MRPITSRGRLTWACRYGEIRAIQVTHLVSVWLSGGEKSKALHQILDEKLDSYVAGELGHAVEAVTSIWDLSRKKKVLPPLPKGKSGSSPNNASGSWGSWISAERKRDSVRASLVKSIQGGALLHRQYWARQSRGGRIYPIYIPSVVSGSTLSRMATCEWNIFYGVTSILSLAVVKSYEGNGGRLEESEDYEFPEDSDCESEHEPAGNPVSGNTEAGREKGGPKLLPVLKIGSLVS